MDKRKSFSADVQVFGLIALGAALTLISGCMSIHTAARAGRFYEVKRQLALGANPNTKTWRYGETPLHFAVTYG